MTHLRTQIRSAVATALTGLATTGSNVFVSRRTALAPEERPALCIYTLDESSGLDGTARGLRREITLAVEGVFSATEANFDAEADAIAAEVEVALGAARTLGGLAYDCVPVAMRLAINSEGADTTGHCILTFQVSTRTVLGAPDAMA